MKHDGLDLPSDKKFGFFFSAVFLGIGLYCFISGIAFYDFAISFLGCLLLLITITKPNLLHTFNRQWMIFGLLLGKLISPIVMGIIFFGLFTPTSLIMKMLKRDELRLKFEKKKTYWISRNFQDIAPDTFKNQF